MFISYILEKYFMIFCFRLARLIQCKSIEECKVVVSAQKMALYKIVME